MLALRKYWAQCREAQATMDVVERKISYGSHRRQYAIVVENRDVNQRAPGRYAFYFHGGGWTFGQPETFTPAAIPWLREGYTVVFPSYRRPPRVGLRRIVADCWQAVNTFADAAGPAPVVHLGGISAGGHLAALLATQPEKWLAAGWGAAPSKALICAGPVSFKLLKPRWLFLPRYAHLDAYQQLAPPLAEHPLEWQFLHGTADPVVDIAHSRQFLARLHELGYTARLEVLEGKKHLDAGRWMFGELATDVVARLVHDDGRAAGQPIGAEPVD